MRYRDGSGRCSDCGALCDRRAKRCKPCSARAMSLPPKLCCDCGVEILRSSTRCYTCAGILRGRPMRDRFLARVAATACGCWEWQGWTAHGYGYFRHDDGTDWRAHRASYSLLVGPIPEGFCVLHSCDNRRCVNPEHLWVGTASDNMRDCVQKGRHGNQHRRLLA